MHIRSQAHVVGEIVAVVVGIVIDHDVIGVPEPVVAIGIVIGCNLEKETVADIKAIVVTAAQTPDMLRADAGAETSVFPGTIKVIVSVIASALMADPAIVFGMDVRSLGMTFLIAVNGTIVAATVGSWGAIGSGSRLTGRSRFRSLRWDVPVANAAFSAAVGLACLWLTDVLLSAMLLFASAMSKDQG